MGTRIAWPQRYLWLRDYALAKPDAEQEYKESWDAMLYRVHSKIFALLLRNKESGTLLNLKCDPYLSLAFRERYAAILPGWHMNKMHWVSLSLRRHTPEEVCRELVDISYSLVWQGLPMWIREGRPAGKD